MSDSMFYIESSEQITVVTPEKMIPLSKDNPSYDRVKDLIDAKDWDRALNILDVASAIRMYTGGKFWVNQDNLIVLDGEVLPHALSKRLLAFVDQELPTESLEKFWANVKRNPEPESVRDLYAFLEHNGIPITMEGKFLGYKYVQEYNGKEITTAADGETIIRPGDFVDCYTGKSFRNNPGDSPCMDREDVTFDRRTACAPGLHVAAWNYVKNNSLTVEVVVDPADVVSVPDDHDKEKMRCCRYTVVRLASDERNEVLVNEDGSPVESEKIVLDELEKALKAACSFLETEETPGESLTSPGGSQETPCIYCGFNEDECLCSDDEEDEDEDDWEEDDEEDEDIWDDDEDDWV